MNIKDNIPWIFSGVGIAVLTLIGSVIRWIFIKNKQEPVKIEISLQSSQKKNNIEDENIIPIHKMSALTPSKINKIFDNTLPLQMNALEESFIGIEITWDTLLSSASKKDNDIVSLYLNTDIEKDGALYIIHCEVSLKDYRGLGLLPRKSKIRVQGKIAEIRSDYVKLIDAKLFFIEG